MERDKIVATLQLYRGISTHTLTWSVTQNLLTHINNIFISTHTLTWSVTAVVENGGLDRDISTHTLTWSVT